jgi:hypothetical protein
MPHDLTDRYLFILIGDESTVSHEAANNQVYHDVPTPQTDVLKYFGYNKKAL